MPSDDIIIKYWQSPVAPMLLGSYGGNLCLCDWDNEDRRSIIDPKIQRRLDVKYRVAQSHIIDEAIAQLEEYFEGKRRRFDIPLLCCGTDFQRKVWAMLGEIPYGSTISYAELAAKIGAPKAVRAVATACAYNPISIIVPCHRVIGADGNLTGYAGGINTKRTLLNIEAKPTIVPLG